MPYCSHDWRNIARTLAVLGALVLPGLVDQAASQDSAKPPLASVVVEVATTQDVATSFEFIGRTEASQKVEIAARVKGTLQNRPFEEGADIKEGTLLFEIDPAEFKLAVESAKAKIEKANATVEETGRALERYTKLVQQNFTSQAQFDAAKSQAAQAKADRAIAIADLDRAELDLSYTQILSPVSGRSGRANVDAGNIIGPESGVLVTIQKLDPLHVYFSVGEREYLNYQQARKEGKAEEFTPRIRLANDQLYAHDGSIDLVDNKVDPKTGTIMLRVKFPNPDGVIVPGQFVNVILRSSTPKRQVVIPQAAVQENQAGPFVLVVNEDRKVEARPIKTADRIDAGIVVVEGLADGETFIVEGIQKARPGAEVNPVPRQTAEK